MKNKAKHSFFLAEQVIAATLIGLGFFGMILLQGWQRRFSLSKNPQVTKLRNE